MIRFSSRGVAAARCVAVAPLALLLLGSVLAPVTVGASPVSSATAATGAVAPPTTVVCAGHPGDRPDPGLVMNVPVLMFHRIEEPWKAGSSLPSLVIPPAAFDAQLRALKEAGWRTITAAQLADCLGKGERPPERSLVLTFDDGYVDGYTNAFPILQRYGFTGTFYIIAGRISIDTDVLTWAQIDEMARAGMDFGNHTYSHRGLPFLSPGDLAYQIDYAQRLVEARTGIDMRTLAYPSGEYDTRVIDETQRAGLAMAFTTRPGAWEAWDTRYTSPRVRVSPWTSPAALVATLARYTDGTSPMGGSWDGGAPNRLPKGAPDRARLARVDRAS